MANFQVTGPLAIVTGQDGKIRYLYTGAPVPSDIDKEQRQRLVDAGLIGEVDDSGKPVSTEKTSSASATVERPRQTAPQEDWVAYAVAKGMPESKAKTLSKRELIEQTD